MNRKTTLELLETINDKEIKEKAIAYYNEDKLNENCSYPAIANDLYHALLWAFSFKRTKEGANYWVGIALMAERGELC